MIINPSEYSQPKGLLVLDELPASLLPSTFIKFLTPPEKFPSFLPAKWLKPNGEDIEFTMLFAKHKYQDGKEVYLYCIPEAMDRAFGIESLETSIKTIGFLIIIDIKRLLYFHKDVTESEVFINQEIGEKFFAVRWAKAYHLPIMLAVVSSRNIENNLGKLSQLIDYSSDMSVAWCDEDMDYDSVQRTMEIIYPYV